MVTLSAGVWANAPLDVKSVIAASALAQHRGAFPP